MGRVVTVACLLASLGCGPGQPGTPPRASASPSAVPSAAPPPTSPPPDAVLAVSAEDLSFCVEETNRYRALAGLPPIAASPDVEAYAADAARADHATGHAHGYTSGAHVPPGAFAENEVVRWPMTTTSRALITRALAAFWAEGAGGPHYENMRGAWRQVGCGLHLDGERATLVQHFR